MRLVCPHCDAAYDVPAASLAGRRGVRCARCGRDWETAATLPESEPAPAPLPCAHEASASEVALEGVPERASAARFGWLGTAVVLALAAYGALAWRSGVMHAWPPSQRAYSALGLMGPAASSASISASEKPK